MAVVLIHALQEEAVEGRRRMTEDQNALLPEIRSDAGVEPPYSHAHVSETAVHREILRIYHHARAETRKMYDLGRDTDRIEEENWVIRWMLWHVFRYRDNRNKSRRSIIASVSSAECAAANSISPPSTARSGSELDHTAIHIDVTDQCHRILDKQFQ